MDVTQVESTRSFSTMYSMIQHGRNTVSARRQFTDLYDCKTTVHIIVFARLDHYNHRPESYY